MGISKRTKEETTEPQDKKKKKKKRRISRGEEGATNNEKEEESSKEPVLPWMRSPVDVGSIDECPLNLLPFLDPRYSSIFLLHLAIDII